MSDTVHAMLPADTRLQLLHHNNRSSYCMQWQFYVGARWYRPPKSSPGPPNFFQDVIGSVVISLSRCCLSNDEGQAPKYFFLEPPLIAWLNEMQWQIQEFLSGKGMIPPLPSCLLCHFLLRSAPLNPDSVWGSAVSSLLCILS